MTLLAPFAARVAAAPDAAALVAADGQVLSRGALDRWAAGVAGSWAARGVGPGTRVLLALPVSPGLYVALMALWRLGAVAVFPEPSSGLAGLRHALAMAGPQRFAGPRGLGALAAALSGRAALALPLPLPLPEARNGVVPDSRPWPDAHPALISFTSGSTGRPKGILRTHGFLLAQQRALAPLLQPDGPARDLVCLPLFVLAGLGLGVPAALPDADLRRPAAVDAARLLRQAARDGLTRLLAPPSVAAALAAQPGFAAFRAVFTGGGPVWPDVMRHLLDAAPGASIAAVYGSTEAEPVAVQQLEALTAADWAAMAGGAGLAAGTPAPGIALRLTDGEIEVAGPHVQPGYLDPARDAETKRREGGIVWHRTGDAGRIGAGGRLWLLGRLAGRAGPHFPFAVEAAARAWPGVTGAALLPLEGRALLAVSGDPAQAAAWRERALAFPGIEVVPLPAIPLDRRHQSKVDYARLRRSLSVRARP